MDGKIVHVQNCTQIDSVHSQMILRSNRFNMFRSTKCPIPIFLSQAEAKDQGYTPTAQEN